MPEPGFVQHVRRIAAGEPMFVDVVSVQLFVEDRDALKVRVTELEAAVAKQEIAFQGRALLEEMWRKEKVALQARIEELEAANAAVEEENDLLRDVIQQKHARVEVLTAALASVLKHFHPREGSGIQALSLANARAALAAGESAPLPLNESGEVPLSYFSKPESESEA